MNFKRISSAIAFVTVLAFSLPANTDAQRRPPNSNDPLYQRCIAPQRVTERPQICCETFSNFQSSQCQGPANFPVTPTDPPPNETRPPAATPPPNETRPPAAIPPNETRPQETDPGPPRGLDNPLQVDSLEDLLVAILRIVIVLATPIVVLFIILAGFKYVTARGDAAKTKEATLALTYAVIGGILIIGAVAIAEIIGNLVTAFE